MKKICLIQVWFGELPFYFEDHLKTCNDQKNVDFLFFTDQIHDQRLKFASSNVKVKYLTPEIYENLFHKKLGFEIKLENFRKLCDHKVLYSHLFDSFLKKYDYVGAYDIDVFWGDVYNVLEKYLDEELISIGDYKYYPGIRGPFFIWKNNGIYHKYYQQIENIKYLLQKSDYQSLDETYLIKVFENNNIKISNLSSLTNFDHENGIYLENGKIFNKKLFINNQEKLLIHFYHKNDFKIKICESDIYFYFKKQLKTDFYWVTYFDKKYEEFACEMLKSVELFSNRKMIIYSLDYEPDVVKDLQLDPDQFKVIRYDLKEKDDIDFIKNIKSYILRDSCQKFKNQKFVYIDSDLFLTVNCDSVLKYFNEFANYPLLNLNVYDTIFITNYKNTGQTISSLSILGDVLDIKNHLYPRRKANFIVYGDSCLWFFNEMIDIYEKYRNVKEGIFGLHDEDVFNILFAKYNFVHSLPTIDIEETNDINNIDNLRQYKYGISDISLACRLPEHVNEILCFHKMKKIKEFEDIKKEYFKEILKQNEFSCYASKKDNNIFFAKKNFLSDKKISRLVRFEIYDFITNEKLFELTNQDIYENFLFYFSNFKLTSDECFVKIIEEDTRKIIYYNFINIL